MHAVYFPAEILELQERESFTFKEKEYQKMAECFPLQNSVRRLLLPVRPPVAVALRPRCRG